MAKSKKKSHQKLSNPTNVDKKVARRAKKTKDPFVRWLYDCIPVPDRDTPGKLVRFVPNVAQQRILAAVRAQQKAGLPVKIIILKARKMGCSTFIGAMGYYKVSMNPRMSAFVCAHNANSSWNLFDIVRKFDTYNPNTSKDDFEGRNKKELKWREPHGSVYSVHTAGSDELERSATHQFIHASEVAFWPHDTQTMTALQQTMANVPNTAMFWESTANGEGNEFHNKWLQATDYARWCREKGKSNLDGFIPLFFSWMDDPGYAKKVPSEMVGERMNQDEATLKSIGATKEQIYWRRCLIRDNFGQDKQELFDQEFPSHPGVAFLTSGRPAIPPRIIKHHRTQVKDPQYAKLQWSGEAVSIQYSDYPKDTDGVWRIWREPVEKMDYAIGADVSEGKLADQNDEFSEPDRSAITVLDRSDLSVVAQYVGRPSPHDLAEEMERASTLYNKAYMTPEVNSIGYSTLERLLHDGYAERLYQERGYVEDIEVRDPQKYGWRTNNKYDRDKLIDNWIQACRPEENDKEEKIKCYSRELVDEESVFVVDQRGKRQHRPGKHDDILFSAMVACEVHRVMPRQRTGYGKQVRDSVYDPEVGPAYRFVGGIDDELIAIMNGDDDEEVLETV